MNVRKMNAPMMGKYFRLPLQLLIFRQRKPKEVLFYLFRTLPSRLNLLYTSFQLLLVQQWFVLEISMINRICVWYGANFIAYRRVLYNENIENRAFIVETVTLLAHMNYRGNIAKRLGPHVCVCVVYSKHNKSSWTSPVSSSKIVNASPMIRETPSYVKTGERLYAWSRLSVLVVDCERFRPIPGVRMETKLWGSNAEM